MNISNHEIGCVSRTLRQATLAIAITRKLFLSHRRASEFKWLVNRATKITVVSNADKTEREMESYPGNPDVCLSFLVFLRFLGRHAGRQAGNQASKQHKVRF